MNVSLIFPVYNKLPVSISDGHGCYLYDQEGKEYLDFIGGLAVNSLGHKHPVMLKAIEEAAKKPIHISNLYNINEADTLAAKLKSISNGESFLFTSSGSEATECAFKTIRSFHATTGNPHKKEIIHFKGAFHGRTMGALSLSDSATTQSKNFGPFLDYCPEIEFNNIDAIRNTINENTAGIIMENIMCHGGINIAKKSFVQEIRRLCDENNILLCTDEIQTGAYRTGHFLSCELYDIKPDLFLLGKGMGGGMPIAACAANKKVAENIKEKVHSSTYSGNPFVTSISLAVLNELSKPEMQNHIREMGVILYNLANELKNDFKDMILDVYSIKGLLMGIKFADNIKNTHVNRVLLERGLFAGVAANNVIRITPPLVIEESEIIKGMKIFKEALNEIHNTTQ